MSDLTVSEFAQRAAGEVSRELLDTEATEVEDTENLPEAAIPKSNGSQSGDNELVDKTRVLACVLDKTS